ncbi:uncharacterized protein BJ171DRAFT_509892 [Polychytrium aggregatum]|uniref:uncharacterized protein n=1 Tax=Polychytrium aggregatum TaxID=110093 RepID=UPI0022FEC26F|nr:uncharacterized protein BJ171DRAFT_509892 [Polychytrium aggregatum]KAI9203531.1 hypothetical protein BJ171DRAFT_509892 [Polychytrium aggregatum]
MGTVTVLFAKATIHLITTSIFQGDNQYTQIWAWVISGITVFTAMSQLYWLNMGLQRYDALLQIPVFYVVWTTFDVIGGGIYFDEFSNFTAAKYVWFCFALLIIFIGVAILANRLKALEDDNREFEKKVQSHQQDALSVQEEARPE